MCLLDAQRLFTFRHGLETSTTWAEVAVAFFSREGKLLADSQGSQSQGTMEIVQQMETTFDYFFERRPARYTVFIQYMDLKLSTGCGTPDSWGAHIKSDSAAASVALRELEHKASLLSTPLLPPPTPPSLVGQPDSNNDSWSSCDLPPWFLVDFPPVQIEADEDAESKAKFQQHHDELTASSPFSCLTSLIEE